MPTAIQTATLTEATASMIATAAKGSFLINGMRAWYVTALRDRVSLSVMLLVWKQFGK